MDDLPKNTNSNDAFSYSGQYPTVTPPVKPIGGVEPPVEPFAQTSPTSPGTPVPLTSSVPEPVSQPFVEPQAEFAATTPTAGQPENPFVPPPPPPPKGGAGKKLLAFLLLFVALIVIGFIAFQVIGRILTQNQPVVLRYWGLWEDKQILDPVIAEYKKSHPNIDIAYEQQSIKQYRERLQSAIDRDAGPDMFRFHTTWLPMLKNQLVMSGKTGYTAEEFQQTFYPVASQDLVVNGKVLGAPLMIDGLGLYYNEDLLRAAGVVPPTTWQEFREAALTLTVKDANGQIVTAGAALGTTNNVEHFSDIVALMMLQNGADLMRPSGKEAQDALSFYHLFVEKPNNVWDATLDNSIQAFAAGRVAFIFAPSWQVFALRELNPTLKFQVIPVPQLPGTSATWASYWAEGVSKKSAHSEEAWEFLKFLSSKESLITLYTEASKVRPFGEPYSRVDLAQTIVNDPFVGAYVRQASTAQSFFLASRTFDNGINDRMIKYLEDAINSLDQGASSQGALETTAQGFSQVLTSFGASAR